MDQNQANRKHTNHRLRKGTNARKNKTLNTFFLCSLNLILYQGAGTRRAFGDRKRMAQGFRRACICKYPRQECCFYDFVKTGISKQKRKY